MLSARHSKPTGRIGVPQRIRKISQQGMDQVYRVTFTSQLEPSRKSGVITNRGPLRCAIRGTASAARKSPECEYGYLVARVGTNFTGPTRRSVLGEIAPPITHPRASEALSGLGKVA